MLWYQQNQLSRWLEVSVNLVPPPSIANLWEQHHLWKIYRTFKKKEIAPWIDNMCTKLPLRNYLQVQTNYNHSIIETSQHKFFEIWHNFVNQGHINNTFVPTNSCMFHIPSKQRKPQHTSTLKIREQTFPNTDSQSLDWESMDILTQISSKQIQNLPVRIISKCLIHIISKQNY